ncbi:DUF2871 domain-containing protein [Nocardia vermiculata]|uniref:DUF2871 domain-containing protein n=1 Tax=Nocardia vermiculata TaxID=257274 RepID=A0A846XTW0_9NOCA|nr:DUF2871 domain-containing protein [Nocardia vermiculata]NKY48985.1 DUF2871 domain-containing protein [Nocardia vermiculata]
MRLILNTAHVYMIVGVISGLYYRELTKTHDFTGDTQLGVLHTHLLTLGMLFFLLVLALEKSFTLTAHPLFRWFYCVYNIGLVLTTSMMGLHGSLTVLGRDSTTAISLLAGLGHIVLTAGLVLLFITIGKRIAPERASGSATVARHPVTATVVPATNNVR